MPSDDLTITLAGTQRVYRPGDMITGHVTGTAFLAARNTHLSITLRGVCTAKMAAEGGGILSAITIRDRGVHRSDFILIDDDSVELQSGPIHATKPASWPFAIRIPTRVSPDVGNKRNQWTSYLPLSDDAIARQRLPDSFSMTGEKLFAGVLYSLEATLTSRTQGNKTRAQAEVVVDVQKPCFKASRPTSITLHRRPERIATQRLRKGMQDVELSWTQRLQKRILPCSVPHFSFHLEVSVPNSIQLHSPLATPLKLRLVPDWDRSASLVRGGHFPAKLTSINLRIAAITTGLARVGPDVAYDPKFERSMKTIYDLSSDQALRNLGKEVFIPSTRALDVGDMLGLRLETYRAAHAPNMLFATSLLPGRRGYNFRHHHELLWAVRLDICGESVVFKGKSVVRLLRGVDAVPEPPPEYSSKVDLHGVWTGLTTRDAAMA